MGLAKLLSVSSSGTGAGRCGQTPRVCCQQTGEPRAGPPALLGDSLDTGPSGLQPNVLQFDSLSLTIRLFHRVVHQEYNAWHGAHCPVCPRSVKEQSQPAGSCWDAPGMYCWDCTGSLCTGAVPSLGPCLSPDFLPASNSPFPSLCEQGQIVILVKWMCSMWASASSDCTAHRAGQEHSVPSDRS